MTGGYTPQTRAAKRGCYFVSGEDQFTFRNPLFKHAFFPAGSLQTLFCFTLMQATPLTSEMLIYRCGCQCTACAAPTHRSCGLVLAPPLCVCFFMFQLSDTFYRLSYKPGTFLGLAQLSGNSPRFFFCNLNNCSWIIFLRFVAFIYKYCLISLGK